MNLSAIVAKEAQKDLTVNGIARRYDPMTPNIHVVRRARERREGAAYVLRWQSLRRARN